MKSLEKENIIAKLNIKNYNKELENILQQKHFSKLCNNLLLSMLYKIENSYEDYKKVKVIAPNKKDYIEELLKIIKDDCQKINIIKPGDENLQDVGELKNYEITTYENELNLLKSLFILDSNKFNIKSVDKIRSIAISKMLNLGELNFKTEVLRDFDGWSWNVVTKDIDNYNSRLLYQVLICLLGYDFLNNNKSISIKEIDNKLKSIYKPQLAEKIIKAVNQLAIIEYLNENKDEIMVLISIRESLKDELELMEDKRSYIDSVTTQKKQKIKEIEKIDKYINDDLELKKEYIKQNEKLPQNERVFSLSDFSEIVQERREKLNEEILQLTEKIKPKSFVKVKTNIEKNYENLEELDLENINIQKFIEELVDIYLKAFDYQIKNIETKKQIIEKIYELRYMYLFNLDNKTHLGDKYKKLLEKTEKKLITKACNTKALTIFSQDIEENFSIYKQIFSTKIIDLDNVYIEVNKENVIKVFDENSTEKEIPCKEFKDLIIRKNKKIKIFL